MINRKAVKQLCKEQGKQISKEALELLDYGVRALVMKSIRLCRGHGRVSEGEVRYAVQNGVGKE